MRYVNVQQAVFLSRPNRFIANCQLEDRVEKVHVRTTGRCSELLLPGSTVYIEGAESGLRKTSHTLIAVNKKDRIVNIDSSAPNKLFLEGIQNQTIRLPGLHPVRFIKPEAVYGASRFDFYMESGHQKAYAEVKGVTLEHEGVAMFPDAPTERGLKHVKELIAAKEAGYLAYAVFIIQMEAVSCFIPNNRTQPEFGEALYEASQKGVHVLAYGCSVKHDVMEVSYEVPVRL